ncbi:MAG: Rpn family recombination-promoting nuclease/putative transposase [Paludibacteraceae bacterium]|nr:Rpn family recombination-promoting nuclease/putative transposase [Paludibacteraceae bacterium]MBP5426100.1 Rpn family recombination-promoting nuclease/putative transposase [Prevotella sp.]
MSKFINPFTDVGFKRIFGQEISKPVLLAFLNSLLAGERRIVDLQYLDKEKIGLSDGDRSLIYDILCLTDSGEYIIVEMQNKSQPFFKNRSVYYLSRSIVEQGERGSEWEYDIKAVYLVAFLNFKLRDISVEFRTDVALMDMKLKTPFSDKMRMIFLQLPYFTKELDDCTEIFEKIIYALKHMEILQRMPFLAQDAVFKRLSEIAEVASLTKEERQRYDESLRHYRDTIAVMHGQYLEGQEKGRAEGRAEGRADVAKTMKESGVSLADIVKFTGLDEEQVRQL